MVAVSTELVIPISSHVGTRFIFCRPGTLLIDLVIK